MNTKLAGLMVVCGSLAWAQAAFDFSSLDKLGKKAKESSTINLDQNTIKLGASLIGGDSDKDSKAFKDLVKGITGVVIKSFEYAKAGMYDDADLEPVRTYFKGLKWSKIVDVKSSSENSEIYLNTTGDGTVGGLAIISAEPTEVSVIYIAGKISQDQIGALSGKMGIPDLDLPSKGKAGKPGSQRAKPDKDDDLPKDKDDNQQ